MHDSIAIPACFLSTEKQPDEPASLTRSGQSVFMSVYRTKFAGRCRLITITWCKNLLLHVLSVSIQGPDKDNEHYQCKVELKPWCFWRKQGSKHFVVDGRIVGVVWDLKAAKFNGETEPRSDYYVAIVCEDEVVLLVGDLKKDAYRRTSCRPSLIEPMLVTRKEHVFAKKRFLTRVKFHEKGNFHEISIEFNHGVIDDDKFVRFDPELKIRLDGELATHVKHLQWKFRGNELMYASKTKVEVYWDVHDWFFGSGTRHGLFIFKPITSSSSPSSFMCSSSTSAPASPQSSPLITTDVYSVSGEEEDDGGDSSSFCLFLYAWKME